MRQARYILRTEISRKEALLPNLPDNLLTSESLFPFVSTKKKRSAKKKKKPRKAQKGKKDGKKV
jgi:hypothetical protein